MKLLRYCIATAFIITSPLCQGFSPSTLKFVRQGLGATGLAALSGYTLVSVCLNSQTGTNNLCRGFIVAKKSCAQKKIVSNNYLLNSELLASFANLSLIGLSTYGVAKYLAYAYEAFNKASGEEEDDTNNVEEKLATTPDNANSAIQVQ